MSDSSAPPAADGRAKSGLRERVRSLQLPPVQQQRSWFSGGTLAVVILLLVLAGGGYLWWQSQQTETATKETAPKSVPVENDASPTDGTSSSPTSGEGSTAAKGSDAPRRNGIALESKGYIIPAHRILVSPKVSGMLMSLNIEEGVRVKKGDILGTIESVEYDADLKRAKATLDLAEARSLELKAGGRYEAVEQAKAELQESREMMKRLEADYNRMRNLVQTGGVTQAEFDQVSADFKVQDARIKRLKFALELIEKPARDERIAQAAAEVAQAEADLTKAQWRLDNCTIRSPISGTILKKNAEEGNIVNAIAFNGSYSVCDMADLSDLEVDLNIQERDISKVFQGQKCKVRAEAYPQRMYEGVVSRLMPIADRAKGAVPVRVKITVPADEEGVYLKPDMGAIVTFYNRDE